MLKSAVNAIRTPFYRFKEYLHRLPQPGFDWTFGDAGSDPRIQGAAQTLSEQGIVVLPDYFPDELLQQMQDGFERVLCERAEKNSVKDSISASNFLDMDSSFARTAFDESILEIMARYFGKPFGLGRVGATRLLPTPAYRDDSYQWHHDGRGRQLHLMVLLTDVSSTGQRMQYLAGSHHRYYSKARGQGHGTRFEADIRQGEQLGDRIVEVVGRAGTAAVFDSNGLHSGTRNNSATRDTVICSYISWPHCWQWKPRIRRADFERQTVAQKRVVTFNPHHQLIDGGQ